MASDLLALDKNLSKLDSSVLKLGSDLRDINSGVKSFTSGLSKFNDTLKQTDQLSGKATKSLSGLAQAGGGALKAFLSVAEVGTKLTAIVTIADAGYETWKKLAGVSNTVTFATAIQGSDKFAKNLQFLEDTSNTFFGTLNKGLQILSDQQGFNQWASEGVKAFSDVEQAAYRLSTITTSGSERSIDAIGKQVKNMRELQKETDFALDSVTLLNAQYDIASAGFISKQENKEVGKASINLAQGGFGNLAGATNAIVRTQRALGEGADTANKRAAQLFQTANVGLLTVDQLTGNIGSLASQAKQLGVSFEDVTTSLAVLTTQGVSADEAATRLTSFLGDVVNISPEAAQALSKFTDEAGKPIQLNAQVLREKGIQGVIQDIKKATNGELSKIQQLFANQTSQEFATLLIGAGDKTFSDTKSSIANVDTKRFEDESKNRGKTVQGAFEESFNKSQAEVEQFGAVFKESVLDQLDSTNGVLGTFANGSAEALGGILGKLNSIKTAFSAVGGFVGTAFSVLAPLAFFTVLGKGFTVLSTKLAELKAQSGKGLFETLKDKAIEVAAKMYLAFKEAVDQIKSKINEVSNSKIYVEVIPKQQNKLPGTNPATQNKLEATKQTSLSSLQQTVYEGKDPLSPKSIRTADSLKDALENTRNSAVKAKQSIRELGNETALALKSKPNLNPFKEGRIKTKTDAPIVKASTSALSKIESQKVTPKFSILPDIDYGKVKDGIQKTGKIAANVGKGAFNLLGSTVLQSSKMLLGLGIAGGVGAAGLAAAGGWAETIGGIIDKKTIPELQNMVETLKDIKNVKGLQESLQEFDQFNAKIGESNILLGTYQETVGKLSDIWNTVTGGTLKYSQVSEEINKRQKLLAEDAEKSLKLASKGQLNSETPEAQVVNRKLDTGAPLTVEDQNVIKNTFDDKIKANNARISLQQQKIASAQKSGTGADVEREQKALDILKQQVEEQNKVYESKKQFLLVQQQLETFKNIDITIPINLQLVKASEKAIETQIKALSKDFKEVFSGNLLDPEKVASQLKSLVPQVEGVLDSLQAQIELDPESAAKLREQLEESLGVNLTKLLAANPQLRQKYTASVTTETTARVKNVTTNETIKNTVLDTSQSLGLENSAITAAKFENTTASINKQVSILESELYKSTTPLARQLEIQQQIEDLESKRAQASADNRIKAELQDRKNLLTVNQQILSVEQAKVAIFSQQNDYDTFSINAAQQKLVAAQKQLEINREQLAITSKEEEIRKEEGVKALQSRVQRTEDKVQNTLNPIINPSQLTGKATTEKSKSIGNITDTEINNTIDKRLQGQFKNLDIENTKQKQVAQATADVKTNEATKNLNKYSSEEQQQIIKATGKKQEELFNTEGTLKIDTSELRKLLQNSDSGKALTATDVSKDIGINALTGGPINATIVGLGKLTETLKGSSVAAQNVDKSKALELVNAKEQNARLAKNRKEIVTINKDTGKETAASDPNAIRVNRSYAPKIEQIDQKTKTSKDTLQASANAQKEQAKSGRDETNRLKPVLDAAKKELNFTQIVNDLKQQFSTLGDAIEISKAKIEAEFASREKLSKFSEAIGNVTSTIGNTIKGISSIAPNVGDIGSRLSNVGFEASNPEQQINVKSSKALAQIESTIRITENVAKGTQKALEAAQKQGADPKILKQLTEARDRSKVTSDRTKEEAKIDRARIKEQSALEIANVKLTKFSNNVTTFNDAIQSASQNLSKIGDTAKGLIDLNQKVKDNAAENSKSQIGLQKAVLGFFGNNNPAAQALGQRLEVKQIDVENKQQKSQVVTEGKKEIIDLSIQKTQLDLESKSLENALTQTQILADLLNVTQGGEAQFSTSDEVQKRIADIPKAIEQSKGLNNLQQGLIDKKLSFIPQEINDKLARADADTAGRKLGALGGAGSLQPSNFDLIAGAFKSAERGIDDLSKRNQSFDVGSLKDSDLQTGLSQIKAEKERAIQAAEATNKRTTTSNKYGISDSADKIDKLRKQEDKLSLGKDKLFDIDPLRKDIKETVAKTSKAQTINNLNNTVNSTTNVYIQGQQGGNKQSLEQQIATQVQKGVSDAIKNLGNIVTRAAKNF